MKFLILNLIFGAKIRNFINFTTADFSVKIQISDLASVKTKWDKN